MEPENVHQEIRRYVQVLWEYVFKTSCQHNWQLQDVNISCCHCTNTCETLLPMKMKHLDSWTQIKLARQVVHNWSLQAFVSSLVCFAHSATNYDLFNVFLLYKQLALFFVCLAFKYEKFWKSTLHTMNIKDTSVRLWSLKACACERIVASFINTYWTENAFWVHLIGRLGT